MDKYPIQEVGGGVAAVGDGREGSIHVAATCHRKQQLCLYAHEVFTFLPVA